MQGFFGKLPCLGDFVTRELPRDFLDGWDDWLQRSMAESKVALGEGWLQTYLNSPIWRFALSPGVSGDTGWAGIVMPSVDKVGRYFPLTIASSLGDHAKPFQILENATDWYDAAESLALNVLHEDRVDPDALASSVNALDDSALSGAEHEESVVTGSEWGLCLGVPSGAAMSPAVCHELVQFQVGPYSAWWSPGSDDADAMGLVSPELPAPQCFAYLLRHSWDGSATAETGGELSPNEITDDAS